MKIQYDLMITPRFSALHREDESPDSEKPLTPKLETSQCHKRNMRR